MPRCTCRASLVHAVAAIAAVCTALVFGAAAAPAAQAAPGIAYGLTDDAWLLDGPGTLDARLATLQQLGVQIVRYSARWNEIAPTRPTHPTNPTDPAYDWTSVDPVLSGLRAHGIGVLLQLVGTPAWANGGRGPNYAPSSGDDFADFATAAARRYPWVNRWLIWNEPNQVRWLRPTSPAVYTKRLLDPAYRAIHAEIRGAQVGGGATAPRGATGGVSPVAWIAGMHAAHARLDAYAHNPYPLDPKIESPLAGGCEHCLTLTMATLGRLVTLVERDFGRARIWLTEYGYQTNPPDRFLGVSPLLQARYVGEAALQAYRAPRVDMLIHYLYRDEPNVARFQSGLVRLNGTAKPAYAAFELPLAEANRRTSTTSLWGQIRAPGGGSSARLERHAATGWRTLATLEANEGGYVTWRGRLPAGAWVRLAAGSLIGTPIRIR